MSTPLPDHPMQPIYRDEAGFARFRPNAIIQKLAFENDLNRIATGGFPQADVDQFWQLLGYSVDGYGELAAAGLVSREAADQAERAAAEMELLAELQEYLANTQEAVRRLEEAKVVSRETMDPEVTT